MNFEHYPEDLPYFERKFYRHYFPKYAHKALRIATVSEYSKNDIVSLYGVDNDKIDVVYNGANESFGPISEPEKQVVRERFAHGAPYFFVCRFASST